MSGSTKIFRHPVLGALKGNLATSSILQLQSLPYGSISQRFARATLLDAMPSASIDGVYDATNLPPASIQPEDSAKTDCKANQFPVDLVQEYRESQTEDCLQLSITLPANTTPSSGFPVLVFLHGGAFFIGSGSRPYYSPLRFCQQALLSHQPLLFLSVNYRLGAAGFFHTPQSQSLVPANNGLHDQGVAFEWIKKFIGGFGGNPENITAIGQSAGAASISLHNLSGIENVWKRSVQLSGSLVTMPSNTPEQHRENFLAQAKKLHIRTDGKDDESIAEEMVHLPVDVLRSLGYVGTPCSSSDILPYETPSMAITRKRASLATLESQIVASTTYDGGISYNMIYKNSERKGHAKAFFNIARDVLQFPEDFLKLYELQDEKESDDSALRKICQFESDIGFFAASLSLAQGFPDKSYFLIFDLGNPFPDGPLPPKQYATHTWDIVALLGAYEDRLDHEYKKVVEELRGKIIEYSVKGGSPWPAWTIEKGEALIVDRNGLRIVEKGEYMGLDTKRGKLLALAEREAGEEGCDLFWIDVCRRFLMRGE